MTSRTEIRRSSARHLRILRLRLGEEIRALREDAGLSLREVAAAGGFDHAHLARIEIGRVEPSLDILTRIGRVLGSDLSVRYFPASTPRVLDRFQAPMIESCIAELDARWAPRPEVPVVGSVRGVIDLVVDERGGPQTVAAEFQSEIRRLEATLRRAADKADALARLDADRLVSRLLVVRSTTSTRDVARQFQHTLAAAYPARTVDAVAALTGPGAWPGPAIVWMTVRAGVATLMDRPPRGVTLGR